MTTRRTKGRAVHRSGLLLLALLAWATPGRALAGQLTAELVGDVRDLASKAPIAGALIVVRSPALQGEQTTVTDGRGRYTITQLPIGEYTVSAIAPGYVNAEMPGVHLAASRQVRVNIVVLPELLTGEEIVVKPSFVASTLDMASATSGLLLDKDFMRYATSKRESVSILEAAPQIFGEPQPATSRLRLTTAGMAVNQSAVYLDGLLINDPAQGTLETAVPPEFLEQVEIRTGGYQPEFGHSMGPAVNLITKSGSNEFHGTIFTRGLIHYGGIVGISRGVATLGGAFRREPGGELGFELGGPIVKDRLWFHLGLVPMLERGTTQQELSRRVDRDKDGNVDVNQETRRQIYQHLEYFDQPLRVIDVTSYYTAKLTFAASSNHRLTLSANGDPRYTRGFEPFTSAINAATSTLERERWRQIVNTTLTYDGKFLDKRLLVNLVAGYHAQFYALSNPSDEGHTLPRITFAGQRDLAVLLPELSDACGKPIMAGNGPQIRCPVTSYIWGGGVHEQRDARQRVSLTANATYLLDLFGRHQLKAGTDMMLMLLESQIFVPGGYSATVNDSQGYAQVNQLVRVIDAQLPATPDNVAPIPGFVTRTSSPVVGLYLQDSWTLWERLNINGGVRIDYQELRRGDGVKALGLFQLSPRVGLVYDFTGTGRSRAFAHYGRYYELIPARAVGGFQPVPTLQTRRTICNDVDPLSCPELPGTAVVLQPAYPTVAPGASAGAVDRFSLGFDYQIIASLVAGVRYDHHQYAAVLEDISFDDGRTVMFANVGGNRSHSGSAIDPVTQREVTVAIAPAQRTYDGLTLYVQKTLKYNFLLNASYTLSRLHGNYAGVEGSDHASAFANNPFNQANAMGLLPLDRTHTFKLDGAYVWRVARWLTISPNLSVRAASGRPRSYLAAYATTADPATTYILPRGTADPTGAFFQADVGLSVEFALRPGLTLSVATFVQNVFKAEIPTIINETYTNMNSPVRPIRGGDQSDLVYLKTGTVKPIVPNNLYNTVTFYQEPLRVRLNASLYF